MRKTALLKRRYRCILSHACELLFLFGCVMLTPIVGASLWNVQPGDVFAFAVPASGLIASAGVGWYLLRRDDAPELSLSDGGVIVLLTWLGAIIAAAFPFMLSSLRLSFSHAVFESVSGLTTTGLTLVDVTKASHAVLLWRSTLQLVGGAGLAIMMMASLVGPASPVVSAAEGRADQLVPHVRRSARLVLALYSGYVLFGVLAYVFVGLSGFDAINHTFTAVATGGFSTHPESIGFWDSPRVEAVTMVLMILGNLNFVTAWLLVSGNVRAFLRNGEIRLLATVLAVTIALVFLLTTFPAYPAMGKAFRTAMFENISAVTGTGFSTATYSQWNPAGLFLLTVLMIIGGGMCSTSGALKQFRVYSIVQVNLLGSSPGHPAPTRHTLTSGMGE